MAYNIRLTSLLLATVGQIAEQLQKMGVQQICPTHCTGDKAIASLKESFGKGYIAGGTGKEIIIK